MFFSFAADVLLFFKRYDSKTKTVSYCGHVYMPITEKISKYPKPMAIFQVYLFLLRNSWFLMVGEISSNIYCVFKHFVLYYHYIIIIIFLVKIPIIFFPGDFLVPILCQRAGYPPGTPLILYEVSECLL